MPRFVLLRHEMPESERRPLHWDFMVEMGQVLATWALAEEPAPNRDIPAERLADHRLAYLDYEGPVSGNRGHVTRVDRGECAILERTAERVVLEIRGERLIGEIDITSVNEIASVFRWRPRIPNPES